MAIVECSVVPLGTGSTSVSAYVASCLRVLEKSGLSYELHAMGTIIEGEIQELFDVIVKMHEVPFEKGAARVVTTIKVDDRRDKKATPRQKVQSVMTKK